MSRDDGSSPMRDDTVRQAASVLACRVGNDMVLLDSAAGRYYSLDEVGATIFELAGTGRSLGQIHEQLVATYDAGPDVVWADLVAFCERMATLGMFVRTPA